jgi:hypothetical protein
MPTNEGTTCAWARALLGYELVVWHHSTAHTVVCAFAIDDRRFLERASKRCNMKSLPLNLYRVIDPNSVSFKLSRTG